MSEIAFIRSCISDLENLYQLSVDENYSFRVKCLIRLVIRILKSIEEYERGFLL